MNNMPHPLFTLISQQTQTAPESMQAASDTSVPGLSPMTAGTQQESRGDAGGGAGGAGGVVGGAGAVGGGAARPAADPWQVAPGVSILAVLDPAGPDGQPGQARFAPGLTLAERKQIMFDDEWFAVRIRRQRKTVEVLK